MDVTNALLVAMMFVMVLSIGIGNILMNVSGILDRRTRLAAHWIPTSWLLLLLLQHLHMFWHTLAILDVETWSFASFLYIVSGPILLFLATSLMLSDPAESESSDPCAHYFRVAPQFFSILAVLMAWMVAVDFVLGKGFTAAGGWNLVLGGLVEGYGLS